MMKLRIAAGLGLVLFMATMIGGPVGVSQADADPVTLADLAGKFASRGGGFFTLCIFSGARISCSSVSPTLVPFNDTVISHTTRDAAGNSCGVVTITAAPVSGTKFPVTVATRTTVETKASFDPTTGSGTSSFSDY